MLFDASLMGYDCARWVGGWLEFQSMLQASRHGTAATSQNPPPSCDLYCTHMVAISVILCYPLKFEFEKEQ